MRTENPRRPEVPSQLPHPHAAPSARIHPAKRSHEGRAESFTGAIPSTNTRPDFRGDPSANGRTTRFTEQRLTRSVSDLRHHVDKKRQTSGSSRPPRYAKATDFRDRGRGCPEQDERRRGKRCGRVQGVSARHAAGIRIELTSERHPGLLALAWPRTKEAKFPIGHRSCCPQ